jgi:hypothetical protein
MNYEGEANADKHHNLLLENLLIICNWLIYSYI